MIEAVVISAAEEKALLDEWFETVQFDFPSTGIPELKPERDDEESRSVEDTYALQQWHSNGGKPPIVDETILSALDPATRAFYDSELEFYNGQVKSGPAPAIQFSKRKALDLVSRLKEPDSGFTVDPRTGKDLKSGYIVAMYEDRSNSTEEISPHWINEFAKANRDLLADTDNVVVAWREPDTDVVWFDVSKVVVDKRSAIDLAVQNGQEAILDLGTGNTINTSGSGRSSYPFVFTRANPHHDKLGKFASKNGGGLAGAPHDITNDVAAKMMNGYAENGLITQKDVDFSDPRDHKLAALGKMQGFDKHPTKGDVDAEIAAGGTELHRGMLPFAGSKNAKPESAEHIREELTDGPYEPGSGLHGNGYYFSSSEKYAAMYADTPVVKEGYFGKKVSGGVKLRAALKHDAKVIDYADLKVMQKEWQNKHKDDIDWDIISHDFQVKPGKMSPGVMDFANEPGKFAAMMGFDAIKVDLKHRKPDKTHASKIRKKIGTDDLGTEFVIINRGALVVGRHE